MNCFKRLYIGIRFFSQKTRRDDLSVYASSIAFFLFVSIIPMLFLVCFLIPYTPFTEGDLMAVCIRVIPKQMNPWILALISQIYNRPKGMVSLTLIMTIWSAGKGMLALMRALNRINDTIEERGYFRLRVIASFYTVIILVGLTATFVLGVFGKRIMDWIGSLLPQIEVDFHLVTTHGYLIIFAVMTLVFGMMYTYIPNRKLAFRKQLPGSAFVVLAWMIFTYGFSLYVDYFSSFTAYGTLGTIILFLLWLYFCSYIMLIGAVINQFIELKTRKEIPRNLKKD